MRGLLLVCLALPAMAQEHAAAWQPAALVATTIEDEGPWNPPDWVATVLVPTGSRVRVHPANERLAELVPTISLSRLQAVPGGVRYQLRIGGRVRAQAVALGVPLEYERWPGQLQMEFSPQGVNGE